MAHNKMCKGILYLCDGTNPNCEGSQYCRVNHEKGMCFRTTKPQYAMHEEVVTMDPVEHPEMFYYDDGWYVEREVGVTQ